MNADVKTVFGFLDGRMIPYRKLEHAPAATMADCAGVGAQLGATMAKNIFLTTKNGKRLYLCITRPEARFHTADISKQSGSSRLSFAPEAELMRALHCRPGSASPMGLIFDAAHEVRLIVDAALRELPLLAFHPCDNTWSLAMSSDDFFGRFLPAVGVSPIWVEIHDVMEGA